MGLEIDPRSGYCNSKGTYYSKRKPLSFPQDKYLDLPTFVSSRPHTGRTALIDSASGETITFPQLWRSVKSLAAGLAELGIRKSDVVLLLSPNSIHFPIICMAILSIGAVVTTTNPLNTAAEIAKQARDSAAVLAFTTPSLVAKLEATQLPILLISSSSSELGFQNGQNCISTLHNLIMASNPADAPSVKIGQDDTATLLYSSGTTGTSKGVISTHRNLISMVCILLSRLRMNRRYVHLCTIPMFHAYGLAAFACGLLGSGSPIVVLSKFDVMEMLGAVEKYRVTDLRIVPPILLALTKTNVASKFDLRSLHIVTCGAAPLSKESAEEFVSRFPTVTLMQGYGMTETTSVGAYLDSEEESRHYGSVGMLAPNTEAKIIDPDYGTPLPPNKRGELWLRGPIVMKGYLNNPEATTSALDVDGWLQTGDLCYIDDDGYIFIVDRLKELIKCNGYQVAPAELEALLLSHPEIAGAAVIPFPNKEAGEVPMAYVVRKLGSTLSETDVIDFVAHQVAPYKKVRRVAFVSVIPKTAAGKILRKDLIKLATSKL
jgi:OPC-8:0 CoA ligase-1